MPKELSTNERKKLYDAHCKKVLSNKEVLARILVGCVSEFKECSPDEVAYKYIEGEPEVSEKSVFDDVPVIIGANTEHNSEKEGAVYFDIVFSAYSPRTEEPIKLIINIESQNQTIGLGYPLLKRAVYYCSRLISSQKNTVFNNDHYGDIKKVYSIWICSHPTEEYKNTIREFKLEETDLFGCGELREDKSNYDLMSIILISLDVNEISSENKLLGLLDTLFNEYLKSSEITSKMKTEYDLTMANELKGDVDFMCNFSEGVYNDGVKKGLEQGLAQGRLENAVEIAVNMLRKKYLVEDISECSGLPIEQIRKLAMDL